MEKFNYSQIYIKFTKGLSPRTKGIFDRRFGVKSGKPETLESIGKRMGITRERVRQIEEVGFNFVKKNNKETLEKIFKERSMRPKVTALKPYFGHNLGGNVSLEVAALLMMFERRQILPTLNVNTRDLDSGLSIATKLTNKRIKFALKTTSAFAGFYSSILFKNLS